MNFNFSELRIGRGPTLTRETSQVVQLFQSLQATAEDPDGDRQEREEAQSMLEELYTRIQNRIEELEDFYVEHDADDRALLFEKQRMALRRLLHTYCVNNEARSRAESARAAAAKNGASQGRSTAIVGSKPAAQPQRENDQSQRLTSSTRKKLNKAGIGSQRNVKPIYKWEKRGSGSDDEDDQALDPFEQPMVTFDVVLTEQEFFAYTSRLREYSVKQRAKKAEIAHASRRKRTAEQRKFEMAKNTTLQASGPYLDPQRLSRSLRRSPQKSQWMDSKGLRPY
eukprot:INCI11179.1.p1 GENE.INCI11179.1~~INCI11179.1.p1  ORF type:complete len:282 (+),score=63.52 INCI11179.1:298-1143(+)